MTKMALMLSNPYLTTLYFRNFIFDVEYILAEMTAGNNGTTTFMKNGQKWYISYAPAPAARYTLAIVVQEDDILAPVRSFRSKTSTLLGGQIGVSTFPTNVVHVFDL